MLIIGLAWFIMGLPTHRERKSVIAIFRSRWVGTLLMRLLLPLGQHQNDIVEMVHILFLGIEESFTRLI